MANPPPRKGLTPPSKSGPETSKKVGFGRLGMPLQPWWLIFLVFVIANYVLTRVFFPPPSSITIPYTFFKKQVQVGNVAAINSVGDSIEGTFKSAVIYPPQNPELPSNSQASPPFKQIKPSTAMRFKTQRPIFADQNLGKLLEEKNVVIEAADEISSSWFKLLV